MKPDLKAGHKKVVSKGAPPIIIQGGQVYQAGSDKHLGNVSMLVAPKGLFVCKLDGATFTKAEDLEHWIYVKHRERILTNLSVKRPKDIEGDWSPSDKMIREEAKRLSEDRPAEEAKPEESKAELPLDENAGKKGKKSHRESVEK